MRKATRQRPMTIADLERSEEAVRNEGPPHVRVVPAPPVPVPWWKRLLRSLST